jgi:hypothetical protein
MLESDSTIGQARALCQVLEFMSSISFEHARSCADGIRCRPDLADGIDLSGRSDVGGRLWSHSRAHRRGKRQRHGHSSLLKKAFDPACGLCRLASPPSSP